MKLVKPTIVIPLNTRRSVQSPLVTMNTRDHFASAHYSRRRSEFFFYSLYFCSSEQLSTAGLLWLILVHTSPHSPAHIVTRRQSSIIIESMAITWITFLCTNIHRPPCSGWYFLIDEVRIPILSHELWKYERYKSLKGRTFYKIFGMMVISNTINRLWRIWWIMVNRIWRIETCPSKSNDDAIRTISWIP